MIFVGHDWAEDHHDVVVLDVEGARLAGVRVGEGVEGVARVHTLVAELVDDPAEVIIGTETDRGLFVGALVAAGYQVFAVNPKAVDRYRDRHRQAGGKSDAGDTKVLADLVRTDRHLHRRVAADSELAEALKVLSRSHKDLIWQRQRQVNQLRSSLREYYPGALEAFGTDLAHPDAVAVLGLAATPEQGRRLSHVRFASALRRAGRQRNIDAVRRTKIQCRIEHSAARGTDGGERCVWLLNPRGGRGPGNDERATLRARGRDRRAPRRASRRRDLSEPPGSRGGAGRKGARRVWRRPGPLHVSQSAQELRGHTTGDTSVRQVAAGEGANRHATSGSLTAVIDGRSARCTRRLAHARTTTRSVLEARGITPRSGRSPTVGSESSTDASPHTPTTTRRPRGRTTSKRRPPLPELDRQRRWGVSAPRESSRARGRDSGLPQARPS